MPSCTRAKWQRDHSIRSNQPLQKLLFVAGMASWYGVPALHAAGRPPDLWSFIHKKQRFLRLVLSKCTGHAGMACTGCTTPIAPCCRMQFWRAMTPVPTLLMSSNSAQFAAVAMPYVYMLDFSPSRRAASTLQTAKRHDPAHLCHGSKAAGLSSFSLRHMGLHG